MRDLLQRPDLFSINTATLGYKTPLPAIIDACAARGIGAIAPWRRELQGEDLQQIAHQLAASCLTPPVICRWLAVCQRALKIYMKRENK